ncbi:hypothetical protein C4578_01705 [Candidatus Microgenomates bacterium]|jgi:hypothetical protein|nr:MAG: hypothetical protein C4578_01705 [Candidatus Microgenomates bacterium]
MSKYIYKVVFLTGGDGVFFETEEAARSYIRDGQHPFLYCLIKVPLYSSSEEARTHSEEQVELPDRRLASLKSLLGGGFDLKSKKELKNKIIRSPTEEA